MIYIFATLFSWKSISPTLFLTLENSVSVMKNSIPATIRSVKKRMFAVTWRFLIVLGVVFSFRHSKIYFFYL